MKLAFTGDTIFHGVGFNYNSLLRIKKAIKDTNLIVNLESPILGRNDKIPLLKEKGGLRSFENIARYIRYLSPKLVNISNNHINDYGNKGVEKTKKFLKSSNLKIKVFGAGYINSNHNIFVDNLNKIVFLSYSTRETDNTGAPLFNTQKLQGPKRLSEDLFLEQSKKYKHYKKIILIHWGEEYVCYPSNKQRQTARDLIDLGADLIIGSHSHTVQGYEKYKEKYIFYSLGNFLMPDIKYINKGKIHIRGWGEKEKQSIMPIFNIEKNISLEKILFIVRRQNELEIRDNKNLFKNLNKPFKKKEKDYTNFYLKEIMKMKIRKAKKALFSKRIIFVLKNKIVG